MIDALLTFLGSSVSALALAAVVRHYHRLRSAALRNMDQVKLDAIAELVRNTSEIKENQVHLHECLEFLKGCVAASNSHEVRISRLEDEQMGLRKRRLTRSAASPRPARKLKG
jgi:hypothetical protein